MTEVFLASGNPLEPGFELTVKILARVFYAKGDNLSVLDEMSWLWVGCFFLLLLAVTLRAFIQKAFDDKFPDEKGGELGKQLHALKYILWGMTILALFMSRFGGTI
jgi:hypothetical protein